MCASSSDNAPTPSSSQQLPVIIAGAGPAGLVAALTLQREKIPFIVYEKAKSSRLCGNAGSGIDMAPTALRILDEELGLAGRNDYVQPYEYIHISNMKGKTIKAINLLDLGERFKKMTDGGIYPWKKQTIDESRGPPGSYDGVLKPLPNLPDGITWKQDPATREWTLSSETKEDDEQPQQQQKGPPVLGRDYVIHTVSPSDTFSGLLLRYKITAVALRRINRFSGTNLSLAPSQLVIPIASDPANSKGKDATSQEYKLKVLSAEFPHLNIKERRSYLEMNDWNLETAKQEIQDDKDWEAKQSL